MNDLDTRASTRGGGMTIARSRGAASGFLLILAGLWGALIPFVGPYFDFAYSPNQAWVWTEARGWLEVLPGVVTLIGGLVLLTSRNRASALLGSWLAIAAGAWFVVGRVFANMLAVGEIGVPDAATPAKTVALELAFFTGLGAVIVFLGALALGRLSVRSVRDVKYAQRVVAEPHHETVVVDDHPSGPVPTTDATTAPVAQRERRGGLRNMFSRNRDRDRDRDTVLH